MGGHRRAKSENTEQIKQNANWMQLLIPRYLEVLLCNFTLLVFCWTYLFVCTVTCVTSVHLQSLQIEFLIPSCHTNSVRMITFLI